jgi:putative redox protein
MALLTATRTHGDYGLTIEDATGNTMKADLPVDQGGLGQGMRPMQTVLAALIACSNVDVVSILQKQKQVLEAITITVDGQREQGVEPAVWKTISLRYLLTGDIEPAKAQRAVALSIEKYCSVAETLRRAGATIDFSIQLNGNQL